MRTNKKTFPAAVVILESVVAPLNWQMIFGRRAPIEVDLGCGDGSFLLARATQHPERDFLGIEQMAGRARATSRKIGAEGLTNARVLQMEVWHALNLLPWDSVDLFSLLFPDPWPKRRHHNRRVVTREFLRAVARVLKAAGILQIKTDQSDYFAAMQSIVPLVPELKEITARAEAELPLTTFERRFQERGVPIYSLALRKISDGK